MTLGRLVLRNCWLNFFHVDQVGWVGSGVAGGAIGGFLAVAAGLLHSFERQISKRIGADVVTNFFDRLVGGDQFFSGGSIYAVKAWRNRGRARDAHVNFGRAGIANHTDYFL